VLASKRRNQAARQPVSRGDQSGLTCGRLVVNLGSIWDQLGSTWGQPGVNLGTSQGQPGQPGVNLGSAWGQTRVKPGSTWVQPGVNLQRPAVLKPILCRDALHASVRRVPLHKSILLFYNLSTQVTNEVTDKLSPTTQRDAREPFA
jgi:hypothetical protein